MFGRKKKVLSYNKETQKLAVRISICTGEKIAFFLVSLSKKADHIGFCFHML